MYQYPTVSETERDEGGAAVAGPYFSFLWEDYQTFKLNQNSPLSEM